MAKHGSRKSQPSTGAKGPCKDCGTQKGPFKPVRYHTSTGKGKMVQYCEGCMPVIK